MFVCMHLKRGPALRQYDTLDCSALSKTRRVTQTSFIDTLVAEARRRNAGRVHGDVRRQSDAGFRKLHICRTKNVYTINRRVNNPGREKKNKTRGTYTCASATFTIPQVRVLFGYRVNCAFFFLPSFTTLSGQKYRSDKAF